jgi:hypothetical protein
LKQRFTAGVNLGKGRAKFSIPFFIPLRDITWPRGSKICRIKTTITGVDLDTGDFKTVASYSPQFSKKMKTNTSYEAITDLPSSNYPLLIYCCGIVFFTTHGKNHLVRLTTQSIIQWILLQWNLRQEKLRTSSTQNSAILSYIFYLNHKLIFLY